MSKFDLGQVVATPNAVDSLVPDDVRMAIERHAEGDWGELDEHDRLENERSLIAGFRLLSVYRDRRGIKFYVITEADRSATTVLLPEDY